MERQKHVLVGVVFLLYMGFDIKYLTHWVDVTFGGSAWIENFQLI